jgi:S-formylglutathione hydrolase FrmB
MKKSIILLLILALISCSMVFTQKNYSQNTAAQGQVLEKLKIKSKFLNKEVNYSIYLPPGYSTSTRSYPVVYLLHGYTDDETAWVQFGEVNSAVDRAIASREIPPMIIVMPDGGVSFYINDYKNEVKWEDFFIEEFIPYIDRTFRTRPRKEFRGISGLSMGGYGSLINAMRHPDVFAACAAFSAAVHTEEEVSNMPAEKYNEIYAHLYSGEVSGKQRITEHWEKYSPYYLAKTLPKETLHQVRWYIDCGDDDFLYNGNSSLHIVLRDREIHHEYRVHDGTHNWNYWRTYIIDGLKFIGESFHR